MRRAYGKPDSVHLNPLQRDWLTFRQCLRGVNTCEVLALAGLVLSSLEAHLGARNFARGDIGPGLLPSSGGSLEEVLVPLDQSLIPLHLRTPFDERPRKAVAALLET